MFERGLLYKCLPYFIKIGHTDFHIYNFYNIWTTYGLNTHPTLADHVGSLRYKSYQRLPKTNHVHGTRDGIGHGEDEPDGPAEFRPEGARYHIVRAACNIIYLKLFRIHYIKEKKIQDKNQ